MITLNKFLEKHSGEIKENMTIMLKNQELGELGLPTMPSAPVVVQATPVQVQPRHESSGLSWLLWVFGFLAIGALVFVFLKIRGVV